MNTASPLITPDALAARRGEPGLRLLDASWHLDGRDARADFAAARLPGAAFFDLEGVSDPDSDLPHMAPRPDRFGAAMGALGLSADDPIVVYDTCGLFAAPRAWWMLRTFGATRVQVLDGGLPAWRAAGLPLEHGPPPPRQAATFMPNFNADAVAALADVRQALQGDAQVIDARGPARFKGQAAEPRAGVRAGHMPGSINLPYSQVLNNDGAMKRGAALKAAFVAAGVDLDRPIITSCGSGVTAAVLTLALAELGAASRLYDGSWAEWGARGDTPIETG